ncbi:hypothetical protein IWX90DRAFT_410391 [Phyllosticta citrichinensis]|uniref:Uncharacterized protein n=1 Tax=Phyllosticta citrichinensis TaxID=1130410 RepID=A0ABR1Y4U5_9PEZI
MKLPAPSSQSLKRAFDYESLGDDVSSLPDKKQRSSDVSVNPQTSSVADTAIDDEDDVVLCCCHRPSKAPVAGKTTKRVVFIDDIKHVDLGKKSNGKSKSVSTDVENSFGKILTVITTEIQPLILRALKKKKMMGCSGRFVSVPADECPLSLEWAWILNFPSLSYLEHDLSKVGRCIAYEIKEGRGGRGLSGKPRVAKREGRGQGAFKDSIVPLTLTRRSCMSSDVQTCPPRHVQVQHKGPSCRFLP